MNTQVERAENFEDNMCVFMKGAPERVISRCSKILVKGKAVEKTVAID